MILFVRLTDKRSLIGAKKYSKGGKISNILIYAVGYQTRFFFLHKKKFIQPFLNDFLETYKTKYLCFIAELNIRNSSRQTYFMNLLVFPTNIEVYHRFKT